MCEQLGKDPDPEEIPPELSDFPEEIQWAIVTFGKLGDRIQPDVGYIGKDLTTLELHMRLLDIEREDLFLETILLLDERMIKRSAEAMKRERDKLKR